MAQSHEQHRVGTAHALISEKCVNNCVFCATAKKRQTKQFAGKEDVLRFIDKCDASGVANMIFSGTGEPTLDPNFEVYLNFAAKKGFDKICLFTNGHNLTKDKALHWKASGLCEVLLSVHGMKEGHDRNVNRKGSFKEALNALETYTSAGYTISVNTCLTRYNLNEIPQLVRFLSAYPIKIHTLSFPEWDGNTFYFQDALLDYEEVAHVAGDLITPQAKQTFFDNIPYCLVRQNIREFKGMNAVQYLDGKGEIELVPRHQKVFPASCTRRHCPLINVCPGFERKYIEIRGWGDIEQHVDRFLDQSVNFECPELQPKKTAECRPNKRIEKKKSAGPFHSEEISVVVKPTRRCNGECVYCSSHKQHESPDMTGEVLDNMFNKVFAYARIAGVDRISFLWHGGEPLLMGKAFFEEAFKRCQAQKDFQIRHMLQSNLLAMDTRWVALFRKFHVNISSSVDPVDGNRLYRNGKMQYPDWFDKFVMAVSNGLKVGVVFTVTASHLSMAGNLYAFFKNLQSLSPKPVGVKLNPIYPSGKAADDGFTLNITPKQFGEFLVKMWQHWNADRQPFPISPFHEWRSRHNNLSCEFSGRCHESFLSVDGEGFVYQCGRFLDKGGSLGNLLEDNLEQIVQNPKRMRLYRREEHLVSGSCAGCKIWRYCRGGCPYFAELYYADPLKASPMCEAQKIFFQKTRFAGES